MLEVTVAAAIAALAFIAMFQAGSTGLFAADSAARSDEAVERAQSHLAALGRGDTVVPGESEGDDGGGYHWRLSVRRAAMQEPSQADQNAPPTSLYDVEVMISWRASGGTRSVVLQSRRIGFTVAPR